MTITVECIHMYWSLKPTGLRPIRHQSPRLLEAVRTGASLVLTLLGAACSAGPATGPGVQPGTSQVATVSVQPKDLELAIGDTTRLVARATNADGVDLETAFTWLVSDPSVVAVSAEGRVIGLRGGVAHVVASAGNLADSAAVRIGTVISPTGGSARSSDGEAKLTVPEGALASDMIVTIRPTDSASDDPALVGRHGYQILPEASSFGKPVELTIAYKSEAIPSGAQESSLALAYLSDQGWTIVSGSSVDTGSKTVTAAITRFAAYAVLATSVVGAVEISPPAVQVAAGDTARLYASILNGQGNLLNGSTHWSSSDTSVASVDATGLVLGRSPGSAEIHVSSGGREARASISVLAGRGTDAHPILFGVHQDLTWDGSPDRRKAAIAAAQMIGARISRSSLLWHLIEPRQGQRDWSRVDSVLAELDRAGLAPLFVVYGSPAWANGVADTVPDHWAYVPTADSAFQRWLTSYADFLRAAAHRYRGRVHYWEMWNEPNLHNFWRPAPDPARYARWYHTAYDAIRSEDPTAEIALGGLSSPCCAGGQDINGRTFLESLYGLGLDPDAVAVHPYPGQSQAPDIVIPYENNFTDIQLIHEAMLDHGRGNRPVWVTEWGWSTAKVSEAQQAEYVGASIAMLTRQFPYVTLATYFLDYDRPPTYYYGLFRSDFSPKPAAESFKQAVAGG